ncbi:MULTISPECIES: DUF1080 domain-containing protein [unclassified Arcicella]|uniref:3-keto-disaccharide hydrolase n=1 Tax=unclassified Arcicella TaxID=2644986 RepID=UPI00285F63CF|nr:MULTISPECIES: DUF1080 domain-containing protein [unclassified Arcicella]MDR6562022.1 hypothetical protein [Arcicella sp. BE51]MDR6811894.1 hypothetical protein [Arcicella sp. BE140]MDR6822924.1 hypothetical protein [Arcicella sp. BE139]
MKKLSLLLCFLLSINLAFSQKKEKGWVSLFDGKTFAGWHVNEEHPSTFTIEDGTIKVAGERAHLFYEGAVGNHDFKNFELKLKAKTLPGSNSGIFIHTAYQASGWPEKGYEVQVNQTHGDWRKTGSLYGINDVKENLAKDNEWYEYHIIVQDKRIIIKIDDKVAVDYTEPETLPADRGLKKLSSGTIALQGHDPKSVAYFKDIKIKILK